MADKPSDIPKGEASTVPSITVDLVSEAKTSDPTDIKQKNVAREAFQNQSPKFIPASPLFESATSSGLTKFSFVASKMSGEKPSSHLGSSSFRASFLRPPQLASPDKFGANADIGENSTKCSFALKPARLSNPFAKESDETVVEPGELPVSEEKTSLSETPEPAASLPKFVPLGTPLPPSQPRDNPAPRAPAPSTSAATGFVFGQNLHEKVSDTVSAESPVEKKDSSETVNNGASCSSSVVESNGTSENLFTSVLKREQAEKSSDSGGEGVSDRPSKSLSEAAKEYEESRAVKRKYEEVTVVTGEEDEVNILQINCKLFAFDKVKSTWVERGRGNLRLNDKESGSHQKQSRIIMRTTGSFRVVLNTKLWPGMVVEKVSSKSVRLTAMDAISGEILIFLVMASPKDADYLFNYLDSRLTSLKAFCAENASSYPDASRKSEVSDNSTELDSPAGRGGKKRIIESKSEEDASNHVSKSDSESIDSQDTGGSDDSSLEKNSGNDGVSNSTISS